VEFDPGRLDVLQGRLAQLDRVKPKYGSTVEKILAHLEAITAELESYAHRGEEAQRLEEDLAVLDVEVGQSATHLSGKRLEAAELLEKAVASELQDLAISSVQFKAAFRQRTKPAVDGVDEVEFLISANPGEEPRPLTKIASGGELSRVMLALKTVAKGDRFPRTLVFDEVDSGIGGRVATSLGEKLAHLAASHQVFCVTHLPQVAAFADQHFHVGKTQRGDRTVVTLDQLEEKGRVDELARMLGGEAVSDTTRQQAKEMLERAHNGIADS
jgi:DNA repair protein RecN (Recombination protein N)